MKRITLKEYLKRGTTVTPSLKEIQREVEAAANEMKAMTNPNFGEVDMDEAFNQ